MFSIDQALSRPLELIKQQPKSFLLQTALMLSLLAPLFYLMFIDIPVFMKQMIGLLQEYGSENIPNDVAIKLSMNIGISYLKCIGIFLLSMILLVPVIHRISLAIIDEKELNAETIFSENYLKLIFKMFLISLILWIFYVIGSIVGLILFIVPGIVFMFWFSIKFSKCYFVLADNPDLSIFDAIKKSFEITNGVFWKVFLYYLALYGIALIYSMAISIATMPILMTTIISASKPDIETDPLNVMQSMIWIYMIMFILMLLLESYFLVSKCYVYRQLKLNRST